MLLYNLTSQLSWHLKWQQSSVITWKKSIIKKIKIKKIQKEYGKLDQNPYVNKNDIYVDYTYS